MKCADDDLVADIMPYDKETFSIECGNIKEEPTFETPPPEKWPRCIPKVCVAYLEKHKVIQNTSPNLWDNIKRDSKSSVQDREASL